MWHVQAGEKQVVKSEPVTMDDDLNYDEDIENLLEWPHSRLGQVTHIFLLPIKFCMCVRIGCTVPRTLVLLVSAVVVDCARRCLHVRACMCAPHPAAS